MPVSLLCFSVCWGKLLYSRWRDRIGFDSPNFYFALYVVRLLFHKFVILLTMKIRFSPKALIFFLFVCFLCSFLNSCGCSTAKSKGRWLFVIKVVFDDAAEAIVFSPKKIFLRGRYVSHTSHTNLSWISLYIFHSFNI